MQSNTEALPILTLIASTDVHLDAWTAKWLLQSEGIQAFLGGHAEGDRQGRSTRMTDIYVLANDVATAKQILEQNRPVACVHMGQLATRS